MESPESRNQSEGRHRCCCTADMSRMCLYYSCNVTLCENSVLSSCLWREKNVWMCHSATDRYFWTSVEKLPVVGSHTVKDQERPRLHLYTACRPNGYSVSVGPAVAVYVSSRFPQVNVKTPTFVYVMSTARQFL